MTVSYLLWEIPKPTSINFIKGLIKITSCALKKNNKEGDEDTMEYYSAKLVDLFYSEQFCFYR